MKEYSKEEIEFIRKVYPEGGCKEVREFVHRSNDSIRHMAKKLNIVRIENFRHKNLSSQEKVNFSTAEGVYFLGLLWADGTVTYKPRKRTYRISLGLQKDDFDKLIPIFPKWKIRERKSDKYPSTWKRFMTLNLESKREVERFGAFGYYHKSEISPFLILNEIDTNLHPYFFRGWLDGDGCWKNKLTISGTYNCCWQSFTDLLNKLNVEFKITKSQTSKGHKDSKITIGKTTEVKKLVQFLYKDKLDIGLERKRSQALEYLKYNLLPGKIRARKKI